MRAWFAIAIPVVLVFSACTAAPPANMLAARIAPPSDDGIVVPTFAQGDSWLEDEKKWSDDGSTTMGRTTSTVQDGPVDVLDAYAHLVPGYEIKSRTIFPGEGARNFDFSESIEASRGNWLKLLDRTFAGRPMSSTLDLLLWSYTCTYQPTPGRLAFFPESAIPVDSGTPRGRTITTGTTWSEKSQFTFGDSSVNTTHTFVAGERLYYALPNGSVPAIRLEHVIEYPVVSTTSQPTGGETGKSILHEVWGHDIPIALEIRHPEEGLLQSLVQFKGGTKPLVYDPKHPQAQYAGVHREATPEKVARAPESKDLQFELPLHQAVEMAENAPTAPGMVLWLKLHPEAYAFQANYYRDVSNRSYLWEIWFTDGKEMYIAKVERKVLNEGQHFDVVTSLNPTPMPGTFGPLPARARERAIVEMKFGFEVGSAFLPDAENWNMFRWTIHEFRTLGHIFATYSMGTGTQKSEQVAPLIKGQMRGSGMLQYVDAFTGRLLPSTGAGMNCGIAIGP